MNRILVTGAAGFIGSHLCENLLKNTDNFVYGVDNLLTGNFSNIENIKNRNFQFIHHDIIDPITLLVDEIYNFASPASPIQYQKNPIYTLKTNIIGTLNMMELAQKNNAKLLQASTSEVYGDPLSHPQDENYYGNVNTIGPRACYDESKRCAETIIYDFNRKYKVNVRVIRIFNTYGPLMDANDGRVVSNFINQSLKSENITIYGDGNQTRSFQYVTDLISAIDVVMKGDYIYPLNVGNPCEFTILELAKKVINKTKSKSKLIFENLPKDDPKQRKPDISSIYNLYKWKPKVSLDDGLEMMIEHIKNTTYKKEQK